MTNSRDNMKDFLLAVQDRLSDKNSNSVDSEYLDTFPLVPDQAIYVFNWHKDTVSYQRGIKELLGYDEDEFTRDLVTSYFHPDDADVVTRLMQGAVDFVTSNTVTLQNWGYDVTYRIRKKNGEYIKVLRQSGIFNISQDSRMVSNYSIISDITFISSSNRIEWRMKGAEQLIEVIEKHMHKALSGFLSSREMDVLKLLKRGRNSRQIAETLFISKNTVDTHRRNMLKKAGCVNTTELVNFAQKNGIL